MEIAEYVQLITLVFQSKDSQVRTQAEERLMQVCQNDHNSINQLVKISIDHNDPLISEAASLTTITAIKKFIANTKPYPIEFRLHHVELFVQVLSKDVPQKIKQNSRIALQTLVNYDKQNQFTSRLQTFIEQSVESKNENLIIAALYVSECLPLDKNFQWFQNVIKVGLENISKTTKILWSNVLHAALDKHLHTKQISGTPESIQEFFLYNETLCQVLVRLDFNINEDIEYSTNVVASLQLIYFSIIVQYQDKISSRCPFMGVLLILTDLFVKSLVSLTMSPTFDHNNMTQKQQNLCNEMIKFLAVACQSPVTYAVMSESRMFLLLDVIYPFFASNKEEQENFINDPNEFIQLAQDVLDEKQSDIPKTSIAKLICAMTKYIDGSTSFFASFTALTATYCIQQLKAIETREQLSIFKELKEHYFLKSLNINITLETSLFLLALLSYSLQNRSESGILFRSFLFDYGEYLLHHSTPIVQTRLCLFIGNYSIYLLRENDELSFTLLNFLICQLKAQKKCLAQSYCAVEAFRNIIEEPKLTSILEPMIGQLLVSLSEALIESDFNEHFEVIKSIYRNFVLNPNDLEQSLNFIVQKIQIEQQNVLSGQKEKQICINQAFNILKILPEIERIIPKHFALIEKKISPLYAFMQGTIHEQLDPQKIDFDEDIVYLISQMINKTKFVSEYQSQIFVSCEQILIKQKYMLGQLFELFNYFLRYGSNLFNNLNIQQFFLQILNQIYNNTELTESSQCEAILLLQLLVQEYHLHQEILNSIYAQVLERSNKVVKNDFFRARLMGVFISGFLQNCQQTTQFLTHNQFLYDHIVHSYQYCQPDYDVKLYVNGFSIFLLKNPRYLTKEILSNIVALLKKQYNYELKKKESDEENEDFDMFTQYNEELEDAKISLETCLSKIKSIDEFGVFQITYQQLKKQINMSQIIDQDTILQKDLDELLKINKYDSTSCPRIIMKLKKRKQQS